MRTAAALVLALALAGTAQANPPFAKLAFREPVAPDCSHQREQGVKLQMQRACRAAAEWGEWTIESGETWDYSRPDCYRLSRQRVRCDVVLKLLEPGVAPSGKLVNQWRYTTVAQADRGCVNLRIWGEGYGLPCWI